MNPHYGGLVNNIKKILYVYLVLHDNGGSTTANFLNIKWSNLFRLVRVVHLG